MSLKSGVRRFVTSVVTSLARRPAIALVLEHPAVRPVLAKLPGSRVLYPKGWDRWHPIDRTLGTDTSGTVAADQLSDHPDIVSHAVLYAGSQPSVMRQALATLPDVGGATFIDLGCGKGRGLVVASELPFARVIGVDMSEPLVAIARRNASIVRRQCPARPPIDAIVGDASRFALPSGDLVIYLYHPFDATLMTHVVSGIDAALAAEPRRLFVVYCNPVAGHCFDASPRLTRCFAETIPYSVEDRGFGPDENDAVIIWRDRAGATSLPDPALDVEIVVEPPQLRASLRPRRRA